MEGRPVPEKPDFGKLLSSTIGEELAKPGDACMASHFTSRTGDLRDVRRVIVQGRCSLSTTFQTYKMTVLQCMNFAVDLTILTAKGVRFGDYQLFLLQIGVTILYMIISFSKPLKHMSPIRPPKNVWTLSVLGSAVLQFLVHFWGILYLLDVCKAKTIEGEDVYDLNFKPSIVNTVMFY